MVFWTEKKWTEDDEEERRTYRQIPVCSLLLFVYRTLSAIYIVGLDGPVGASHLNRVLISENAC